MNTFTFRVGNNRISVNRDLLNEHSRFFFDHPEYEWVNLTGKVDFTTIFTMVSLVSQKCDTLKGKNKDKIDDILKWATFFDLKIVIDICINHIKDDLKRITI